LNHSADNLIDLNVGDINLSPLGFDGSAVHTYRLVRHDGKSLLYLFDNTIPYLMGELATFKGAATDGETIMFGIPGNGRIYRFFNIKISSDAYVPEPRTVLLLGLGGLLIRKR
jgi:hypothetical protein